MAESVTPTPSSPTADPQTPPTMGSLPRASGGDRLFLATLWTLGGAYAVLVVLLVVATIAYASPQELWRALDKPEIRYAFALSMLSCTATTILCVWIAVPLGYLLSRYATPAALGQGPGRRRRVGLAALEAVLDVPIVLPPLVVGISLLILFKLAPFRWISAWVVYEIPAVILAQFVVACAFAVRTMRSTFDEIPIRQEQVAMTLGASHSAAFWTVVLPLAARGVLAAATLSWARSLGEFGPVLVFASSTRLRTEVLPTSVYLEMQAGNLQGSLAVSVVMIVCAIVVLVVTRLIGWHRIVG